MYAVLAVDAPSFRNDFLAFQSCNVAFFLLRIEFFFLSNPLIRSNEMLAADKKEGTLAFTVCTGKALEARMFPLTEVVFP